MSGSLKVFPHQEQVWAATLTHYSLNHDHRRHQNFKSCFWCLRATSTLLHAWHNIFTLQFQDCGSIHSSNNNGQSTILSFHTSVGDLHILLGWPSNTKIVVSQLNRNIQEAGKQQFVWSRHSPSLYPSLVSHKLHSAHNF